jgi:CAAX prenyl protease-like protein
LYRYIFFGEIEPVKEKKIIFTFKLVGYGLIVHMLFSIVKVILKMANLIEFRTHPTVALINDTSSFYKLSIIFFISVIVAPMIEELSFRLMIKPYKSNSYLGFGFLVAFMFLLFTKIYEKTNFNTEVAFHILFVLIALGIAFSVKILLKKIDFDLNNFIESKLPLFIFISSFLFSLSHIYVVDSPKSFLLYIPILLPYFFIGYILSYARLSMGFFYAFLCHALNNLFFFAFNAVTP